MGKTAVTQTGLVVLAERAETGPRVSQTGAIVLGDLNIPPSRLTQTGLQALAGSDSVPYLTQTGLVVLCNQQQPTTEARLTQTGIVILSTHNKARLSQTGLIVLKEHACPNNDDSREYPFRVLKLKVKRALGENEEATSKYWSETAIERAINDAYLAICRDTKCLEAIDSQSTVVGTAEYSLQQTSMQVKRVFLADIGIPNTTKWERDREHDNWEGQSQEIRGYIQSQQNNRTIRLDQLPTAVEDLDVWVVTLPTAITDLCTAPDIPVWVHPAIVFKAAARLLRHHGEMRDSARADAYDAMAEDYLSQLSRFVANRTGERVVH